MLDCSGSNCSKEGDTICCRHCQGNGTDPLYWDIPLDQDLLETIIKIYPQWFQEDNLGTMTHDSSRSLISFIPNGESISPLKESSEVDEGSLQSAMDRNKESLKVKLMLRRPINQLIDQGILPPLKTPPSFFEQRQKLERAKMGDFLKHKIQRRPQRHELIEQHILEDTTVDPSLHEKQRQLKKARLADDLNDRLSHRPGPLELIKGNILHADEPLEQAIKEGAIHFKKTSEGEVIKHPPPRFVIEEESSSDSASSPQLNSSAEQSLSSLQSTEGSSEIAPSPLTSGSSSNLSYIVSSPLANFIASPSSVHSIVLGNTVAIATPSNATVVTVAPSPSSLISNAPFNQQNHITSVAPASVVANNTQQLKDSISVSKSRKKSKSKSQPKTRTIKFHEYKGPPNIPKNQTTTCSSSTETSYDLLLQQQQLFLQWQLELQKKYPILHLPSAHKQNMDQDMGTCTSSANLNQNQAQVNTFNIQQNKSFIQNSPINESKNNNNNNIQMTQNNAPIVGKIISKLEDMKVSDLKAELKKRHLPVSGAKQQLIDRLKPFTESVMANAASVNNSIVADNDAKSTDLNTNGGTLSTTDVAPHKVQTVNELVEMIVPMSPDFVSMSPTNSPTLVNNKVEESISQDASKSSEDTPMDVDVKLESEAMDVMPENIINGGTLITNEDILRLQQQRIEELQRELQKSQIQLKLQQNNQIFSDESQSSINNISLNNKPQIHMSPLLNSIDTSSNKSIQRQLLQQHLQQRIQQQQLLQTQQQQQQLNNNSNRIALISNESVPTTKSNVTFLHGQQIPQTQTLPQTTSIPTVVTTHLINAQNGQPIQQLILCPTVCTTQNTTQVSFNDVEIAKQRNNSLPNGLGFNKVVSQRTSSLPNFSTLISTQSICKPNEVQQINPQFILTKPPPDYNEATKQINKNNNNNKEKKKSIKSQAVDDVLEILIKNGELPPSAAQEPQTPTTPEKIAALKNPLFQAKDATQKSNENSSKTNNMSNDNNNKMEVQNVQNQTNHNVTLDFDFILDLEGLTETIDMTIHEKNAKQDKINNNLPHSMSGSMKQCGIPSGDLSLSEFMDFQECALNVDDDDWLEVASGPTSSNAHGHVNNQIKTIPGNIRPTILPNSTPISGTSTSKHDPILPNTMLGGNTFVDPLGDLFFDDNEFKTSVDLGTLMWDKRTKS